MYTPYVRISSGNVTTTLDASARNTLGCIYSPPPPTTAVTSAKGYGAQPVFKYVYYNSTANPAPVAAPAPVYWTDESFTTVTGVTTEAYSAGTGVTGVAIAGYLMPNTTALSTLTAAQLNQSYVWIQIGGLLVGAYAPTAGAAAIGNFITGLGAGNWTSTSAATITAGRQLGVQYSAVVSSACDVLVSGLQVFWGS
jgi:hypothetical protein